MHTILIFGAGKSASTLIEYLGKCCEIHNWQLIVCDADLELAQSKIIRFPKSKAVAINVLDDDKRFQLITKADLVISMLPPALHFLVAKDCVRGSKNLLTASYLDENIKSLEKEVNQKGILFLCEMGLDPGIDHMSAMELINQIKAEGGLINSFRSHCGGLISPESDDNPWHYKITWNPMNVVNAGSAGAIYLENNEIKKIAYRDVFKNNEEINIPNLFPLAWYANRDSLPYIDTYQLQGITTFIRTTLRYPAFCRGWNKIVQMDFASSHDQQEIKGCTTFLEWYLLKKKKFLSQQNENWNESDFFTSEFLEQVNFLGLNQPVLIELENFNSVSLLQYRLEKKLAMQPDDKDMIVMMHEIEYSIDGEDEKIISSMIVKGENKIHTAMSRTVGLPLGIAAKLILLGKINLTGLHIPVIPEIYKPVLEELETNGIVFNES